MKKEKPLQYYSNLFLVLSVFLLTSSCGSFYYAGYDNDGIYSSDVYRRSVVEQQAPTYKEDNSYYQNYFAQNKAQLDDLTTADSDIFGDTEVYESNAIEQGNIPFDRGSQSYVGRAQVNDGVTINIIDSGFRRWNNPWLLNAGWGWGPGWNNWGWSLGWNNWGWGPGWNNWGWGPGWNNWGWNPGWNNWGWNNGYRRRVAFQNSRRGLLYNNNISSLRRGNLLSRSNTVRRRANSPIYRRGSAVSRRASINNTVRRNRANANTSRTGTNVRRANQTRTSKSTNVNTVRRSRSSSGSYGSSKGRTRSSSSIRSPRNNSRSSGSYRSGSGSQSYSGSRSGGRSAGRSGRQ